MVKLKLFLCMTLLCAVVLAFTAWLAFAAKPDKPMHKVKVSKVEWWAEKSDKLAEKHFGIVPGKRAWLTENIGLMQKWSVVAREAGGDIEIEYPTRVVDLPDAEYLLPNGKVNWQKVADRLGLTVPMAKALNPGVE